MLKFKSKQKVLSSSTSFYIIIEQGFQFMPLFCRLINSNLQITRSCIDMGYGMLHL